ncbi:MAG: hypothetical protein WBP41_06925, partial [Saprospiraceae bacterium]
MKFSLLAMFCLLTFHPNIFAQQHIIDSLRQDLHRMQDEKKSAGISDTTMRDTFIIYTLTRLAILHSRSNVDSGLYYANQVVD